MSLATPDTLRRLQRTLYVTAKREPARRFHALYDKVWRDDTLAHAYALSRTNGGAPGVDGETFAHIEASGRERWLGDLREEVRTGRYTPQPVRRVLIPKASGVGQRPLGIPTIRDRVVQTAAVLVLEPIFEADFDEAAYGYRPRRSALDAVRQVSHAIDEGHAEVVDADLSKYFDTIPALRVDDERGPPHQRWQDAAADQAVAEGAGRRDRRAGESSREWREEGDAGNTAGRGGRSFSVCAPARRPVEAPRAGQEVARHIFTSYELGRRRSQRENRDVDQLVRRTPEPQR